MSPTTLTSTMMFVFITKIILERHSLLNILILLESISLIIISMGSFSLVSDIMFSSFMVLAILTMSACEASLALSLLVAAARNSGKDKLPTVSTLC